MVKHLAICDRCGKECTDGIFYTVHMWEHNVNDGGCHPTVVDEDYKHLCKDCRDYVKTFINLDISDGERRNES